MVIDLYTEQNILIAILGTVGVLTAAFVLTYSFIWQGREELKRKRTTNDSTKEIDEAFHESWELYYPRWSTESAEEA